MEEELSEEAVDEGEIEPTTWLFLVYYLSDIGTDEEEPDEA